MKITLQQLIICLVFCTFSYAHSAYSQFDLSKTVSLQMEKAEIKKVLSTIEKQVNVRFVYSSSNINTSQVVTINVNKKRLDQVLNELLLPLSVEYLVKENRIILRSNQEVGTIIPTPIVINSVNDPVVENNVSIDNTIKGTIIDENGEKLPGVSVMVKGTSRGITSNAKGEYSIAVTDDKAVLVFSYVGYERQEILVGNRTSLNVSLKVDNKSLSEVVVVGYGIVKRSDLTGSVSQVKSKELNVFPAANVLQALSGRAAGVQVTQNNGAPGAGVSVRIRGTNSIQGSNEPLYVVDGFPISGSNPTMLNNADIESIEILKDASATAIYGSRGANGVVLITTKQGKSGKTKVDFETSYSTQTLRKKLVLMNAQEYATFNNLQAVNDKLIPFFSQAQVDAFGEGFDWQNLVFQSAPMKTTSLNISGGNEKTQFSISGSFFGQDGIVKGSDYNRYSLRTNINHKVSEKFSVNLSNTITKLITGRKDSEGNSRGSSMISAAISAPPTFDPYNADGTYRVLAIAYPFVATDLVNPLNFINEQTNVINANRVLTNAALIYKPIREITVKISGGVENADDRTDNYTTRNYFLSIGRASVSTSQFISLLNENTISFDKTFKKIHSISALGGFTFQDFVSTSLSGSGNGFLSDVTETSGLSSATTPGIPSSSYSKSVLLSYLARVNYGLKDKYLATISVRRDGSSRYSDGNKWSYFPSAALAWRIANEGFMKNSKFISDLKLRASWGFTGSQAISPYATLNQLSTNRTVFNDALYTAFAPGTRLPGNLKWETTEQKDIGIDFAILNNRLLFTADYYIKNTRDLLNNVVLPASLGFTSTIQNIGEVQNNGIELGIDGHIFTGAFKWDLNANVSFNRNKVVKLTGGADILGGNVGGIIVINDVTNILREGQPIGMFWGYLEDGYTQEGKIKFQDLDGNGTINQNDKTYIGNPNPDFIYGINSIMSYKNFDLSVFIQGVQGNDLFNASAINNTIDIGFGVNMPKEVLTNHWTPTNINAKYPKISRNTNSRVSNRFIEDGSYLRLRNIQLAYNLPVVKWGIKWINSVQLYVSGQNLLTVTKYSWWDPEVNSKGGANSTSQGIDHNSYPTAKSFTAGLRTSF